MPKVFAGNYAVIFDIKGKKAVVVGGAGGFGKEIAKAFAQRGVDVLISSRREDALKAACEDIKAGAAEGVKVTYFAGDAGDAAWTSWSTLRATTRRCGPGRSTPRCGTAC